ncbi:MAG: monocarboxylate uptake permease MctP [Sulfuriferula sp.]
MNIIATVIFVSLFVFIAVLGFASSRWRSGDLSQLHEWGLGGRRFGAWVSWFLIGGDLYTAYTFIAVPALVFSVGAFGFFAVPFTVLAYPLTFSVLPRLWAVSRRHNFITASDFIRSRFDSPSLALVIAITGIVATMPYIALQLIGIQVVIGALGFPSQGWIADLPLTIAFVILAVFTYTSGLRAPAMIAVVKDLLVYITVIAVVIVVPLKMGGFGPIFAAIPQSKLLLTPPDAHNFGQYSSFITLALGSALAVMLYPHALTALLSAKSSDTLRRNWIYLPAYSLMLGFIALLGYFAYAAGLDKLPEFKSYFAAYHGQFAVPGLLLHFFPAWFVGIGFAAVAIGALVPAAIMSIAAANLFTRNIYKEYINPLCSDAQESKIAKLTSLLVKFGALLFIVLIPQQYAINLQLLGGILMLQILPALATGLYTRWFDGKGLLLGWAAGVAWGGWMVSTMSFKASVYSLHLFGYVIAGYAGFYALLLNLAVAIVATIVIRAAGLDSKQDGTLAEDYIG